MPTSAPGLKEPDYQSLAHFRHLIRRFLAFSEREAREAGLKPQQHQLLLAVKGLPPAGLPTVGALAWQLQLRHHTVVELVDRLSALGLVRRSRNALDQREVLVEITPKGEGVLRKLSVAHREELRGMAPLLLPALTAIFESTNDKEASPWSTPPSPPPTTRPTRRPASATSRPRRGSSRSASSPSP